MVGGLALNDNETWIKVRPVRLKWMQYEFI